MSNRFKASPLLKPEMGGHLLSAESHDQVGPSNYVRKLNFRRKTKNSEGRREGWVKLRPNSAKTEGPQCTPEADEDIVLLAENVRPNSQRALVAATETKIYCFDYTNGEWDDITGGLTFTTRAAGAHRWQAETINGYLILNNGCDLPVSYRVEDSQVEQIKELREVGIASVRWILNLDGWLLCLNIREIQADELADVMTGVDPYGPVADAIVNHVPYRVIWGEFGEPTRWAPIFDVVVNSASQVITLPFASSVFVENETRVAVINGGVDGAMLGGDETHLDGILVTDVTGAALTLEVSTAGTFPKTISICRWSDVSTVAGRYDLQGDASHILGAKKLAGRAVIYRDTGIWLGRYTGADGAPFEFREAYWGHNVPTQGEAIAKVEDEYHLYPSKGPDGGKYFYAFNGVDAPKLHSVMNGCRDAMFDDLEATDDVFAIDNPMTREIWFCRPEKTLAFDYVFNTASEIDVEIGAAVFAKRPTWDEDWFMFAVGDTLYRSSLETFFRDGTNPGAVLEFGWNDFGDPHNEKLMNRYQPQFSSRQTAVPLRITIKSSYSPAQGPTTEMDEVFDDLVTDGMIPTHFLGTYFKEILTIDAEVEPEEGEEAEEQVDGEVEFIGRVIKMGVVPSAGAARNDA